jgi:hypothetical protein
MVTITSIRAEADRLHIRDEFGVAVELTAVATVEGRTLAEHFDGARWQAFEVFRTSGALHYYAPGPGHMISGHTVRPAAPAGLRWAEASAPAAEVLTAPRQLSLWS